MKTYIETVTEKVRQFCNSRHITRGFIATNGEYCLKCADYEAAMRTKLPYVFFVDKNDITIY